MELFKGTNLIDFIDRFDNEEKCKKYLAEIKWANGFTCSKCNHSHYWTQKKDPFVKVCKGCRHIESVTANTPVSQSEIYTLIYMLILLV